MAMRSILNLDIHLGLFGFPVKVYKGTDDAGEGIGFRQLHAVCNHPINLKRSCECCGATDIAWSDLAKGYEYAPGQFVTVTDAELTALKPAGDGTVAVKGYLAATDIEAAYLDGGTYLLAPGGKDTTTFAVFRDALAGRVALGTATLWKKERVVAIRAHGRMLALSMLRNRNEVRQIEDMPGFDKVPVVSTQAHRDLMAQVMDAQMLDSIADVQIDKDRYQVAVKALIDSKLTGVEVPAPVEEPKAAPVADLAAMLKASLAAAKKVA